NRGGGRADDDGDAGAQAAGLGQLTLERTARVVGVGRAAGRTQPGHQREDALARGAVVTCKEDVDRLLRGRFDAGVLECEQQPLDPGAEADSRRRGPADFLGEIVVAATARDRALRAVLRSLELPGRARV